MTLTKWHYQEKQLSELKKQLDGQQEQFIAVYNGISMKQTETEEETEGTCASFQR